MRVFLILSLCYCFLLILVFRFVWGFFVPAVHGSRRRFYFTHTCSSNEE